MTKKELEDIVQSIAKKTDILTERVNVFSEKVDAFREEVDTFRKTVNTITKDTDKKIAIANEKIDALIGKWGRFVESIVSAGVEKMFKERGIEVEYVSTRVRYNKNGEKGELDILVENKEYVVPISVKSTLKKDDVDNHIHFLTRFKYFFPRFKDSKVIGAVAGIVIDEGIDKYAYRKGLFIIAPKGEIAKILNDKKFKPKIWD